MYSIGVSVKAIYGSMLPNTPSGDCHFITVHTYLRRSSYAPGNVPTTRLVQHYVYQPDEVPGAATLTASVSLHIVVPGARLPAVPPIQEHYMRENGPVKLPLFVPQSPGVAAAKLSEA
jgi:hypothetical protein